MKFLIITFFVIVFYSFASADIIYVSSIKTSLYKDADRYSFEIVKLNKGTELNTISENNNWIKVTYENKTGWVQKIFTSREKPGNKISLFGSDAKKARIYARKRASSDVTAASARGLMKEGPRGRGNGVGKAGYYNPEVLSKIEQMYISEEELLAFLREGGIAK